MPFDRLERQYLSYTMIVSLLGIALALAGKQSARLVGLATSVFTLALAVLDAVAY